MTDPTNMIDSYERASAMAWALIRLAPEPVPALWQELSARALAALLYAASPEDTGRGMNWVYQTLLNADERSLTSAATAAGADAEMIRRLRLADDLDPGQRQTLIIAMRRAVDPWLQPAHTKVS
ncbi:MAG: hypothetical protein M3Y83_16090 [Actinomycetota bacterium]|jgi:hypothetical protein|nr:hypothetical protein [Actinomycetota bacterium]